MNSHIESDFASLFKFLELQDQEVLLYSKEYTDEQIAQIKRFVSGELNREEDRERFFAMIRDMPHLLIELAKQIEEADNRDKPS